MSLPRRAAGKCSALHEQVNGRHEDVEPQIERQHAIYNARPHQLLQRLFELLDGFNDECDRRVRMFFADG